MLRGSRGDAAGIELGSSFVERITVNTGTVSVLPESAYPAGMSGWVHRRPIGSGGAAVLPGSYTFTAGDAGRHDFSVTYKTAGARTLTVTDSVNVALTASASFQVLSASASGLAFLTQPVDGAIGTVLAAMPEVPLRNVRTMEEVLGRRTAQRRLNMLLLGGMKVAVDGRDITLAQTATATEGFNATDDTLNNSVNDALTGAAGNVTMVATGSLRLTASEAITISGAGVAKIGFAATGYALGNSALNSASVTTAANANTMLSKVDAALQAVSTLRSTFGAVQNRFESTVANLQATSENLSASRSRVQDADFAEETAALTKNQILQQAGVAMLAQANSLPQNVLSLLRG